MDSTLEIAPPSALETVRAYHQRSKHQLRQYAAGPDTLDWDAQPDPFRRYAGAPLLSLPLAADTLETRWSALHDGVAAHAVTLAAIGSFFELSFALTAWKQHGPDRWALRANPSSGNLHPTEAYLIARGVSSLADGLYHYAPREHGLELRARLAAPADEAHGLWIGLSSIQWREAWKYGERAFRYCQLDTGHAVGAVRYAAAALGWKARVVPGLLHEKLAALMGVDRPTDTLHAEPEEPELLMQLGPVLAMHDAAPPPWPAGTLWLGQANRLDAHPMYRWPVIDEVARATRATRSEPAIGETGSKKVPSEPLHDNNSDDDTVAAPLTVGACAKGDDPLAATLIRQRRSAQHFERRAHMSAESFFRIAAALLLDAGTPWDAWPCAPRVHAVFFAHRVNGLAPGAYLLTRHASAHAVLSGALNTGGAWASVAGAPAGLPLQRMVEHPALAGTLRTLSCHQAIASDACFAVSLLAEFDPALAYSPRHYRALYQEAGLIGQVLYLEAEAAGLRGTGIGCYFDDAVHELLGVQDTRLQVLYHFTVGVPLGDDRITTEAPYLGRTPVASP